MGKISSASSANIPDSGNIMDEYAARLKVILPGVYEEYVDVKKINIRPGTLGRAGPTKRYIMMKLEEVSPKNVLQSNNIFFVEV